MRETKLVLIDGLPGSGKTTTARFLATRLRESGVDAACLLEVMEDGRDHPLNVGGSLHPAGRTTGGRLHALYTVESYVEESLRRWQDFVRECAHAATVQVVESYPYQNSVRVLLQMDADMNQVRSYAAAVEKVVQPLNPVLIYFEQQDVEAVTRAAATQRGPEWMAYVAELAADSPYARRLNLRGFEGVLTVLAAYKAVLDDLRRESCLPALVLSECAGDWSSCHRQILAFLEL